MVFREAYQQTLKIRYEIRIEDLKNKSCLKRARKIVTPIWIWKLESEIWGLGSGAMVRSGKVLGTYLRPTNWLASINC